MKKLISNVMALIMTLTSTAIVLAEETAPTVFELNFADDKTTNAEWSCDGWTVIPKGNNFSPKHQNGNLSVGHPYVSGGTANISRSFEASIGMSYRYDITVSGVDGRMIPSEELDDGELYTAKTVINNGAYELNFSIEADGIYGYNKSSEWTRLWSGTALTTEPNSFTVIVEGANATVYKNDGEMFSYELAKSLKDDSYFYGTQGIYGTMPANSNVQSIKLCSLTNEMTAPTELVNLGLSTETDIAAFLSEPTWTFEGNKEKLLNNKNSLKFEGNAAASKLAVSKAMNIGSSYLYEIDLSPHGSLTNNRFVGTNDAVGDYYTAKTEITNGRYKMAFSIEKDGIYALDSNGTMTKMYDGTPPADANGNYLFSKYQVSVSGDRATVSRNGIRLFAYTMPANLAEAKYFLGLNRKSDNAIFYAKNIKIYNYESSAVETAELINFNFAADTSINQVWSCDNWLTVGNNNTPRQQYGYLNMGHPYVSNGTSNISTAIFASPIGSAYRYDITVNGVDGRMISSAELNDGELYTAKTVINNGAYELNFTIEADGIYGYDKNGDWKKLWDGTALTTEFNNFTVIVDGASATVYKNEEKLFTYELSKALKTDSYFYGVQGENGNGTNPANSRIQSIKLISLESNKTTPMDIIDLALTTSDDITAFKDDTSWTVTGSADKLIDQAGSMQFVGNNHPTLEISKNLTDVGKSYAYQFDALPMGTTSNYRFATTSSVSKDYYTIGSTIKNGAYILQFSVEYDGIYALTSDGVYTKISDGIPPADSNGNWIWATYTVLTEGNKAIILRDGIKLASFTMPENKETEAYKFGKSTPGKYEGNFYVRNIRLCAYPVIDGGEEVVTEKNHFNFVFNANDENGTFAGITENVNWTLNEANTNGLKVEGGNLAFGHAYSRTPSMSTDFFASPIGSCYTYMLDLKGRWAERILGDECLTDGTYYTVKSKITNGLYKLELTFEETGVYGYNSENKWTKLYPQAEDSWNSLYSTLTTNSITVQVKGKNAAILRDGVKLFTYTMPETTEADSYSLSASGKSPTYGEFGQIYVNNISLTSTYSNDSSLNARYDTADGKLTVTVADFNENINSGDAYTVIVAAYNADNEMTAVNFAEINKNTSDKAIDLAYTGTETVLIYIWDSVDTMKSLSEVLGLSDIE